VTRPQGSLGCALMTWAARAGSERLPVQSPTQFQDSRMRVLGGRPTEQPGRAQQASEVESRLPRRGSDLGLASATAAAAVLRRP
jgi:hypothetical protein